MLTIDYSTDNFRFLSKLNFYPAALIVHHLGRHLEFFPEVEMGKKRA